MAMDQYLLIPFLVEWTSIYQLFWCELQGYKVLTHSHILGCRSGDFSVVGSWNQRQNMLTARCLLFAIFYIPPSRHPSAMCLTGKTAAVFGVTWSCWSSFSNFPSEDCHCYSGKQHEIRQTQWFFTPKIGIVVGQQLRKNNTFLWCLNSHENSQNITIWPVHQVKSTRWLHFVGRSDCRLPSGNLLQFANWKPWPSK